jgi:hypothetical protein
MGCYPAAKFLATQRSKGLSSFPEGTDELLSSSLKPCVSQCMSEIKKKTESLVFDT